MIATDREANHSAANESRCCWLILVCVLISLVAGFVCFWFSEGPPGVIVLAGLVFGTGLGLLLWGREAGVFRGDRTSAMRPAFRIAAGVVSALMLLGSVPLLVMVVVAAQWALLLPVLNGLFVGITFLLLLRASRG